MNLELVALGSLVLNDIVKFKSSFNKITVSLIRFEARKNYACSASIEKRGKRERGGEGLTFFETLDAAQRRIAVANYRLV